MVVHKFKKCVLCGAQPLYYPNLSFHRFPKSRLLQERWARIIGIDHKKPLFYQIICSRHFPQDSFCIRGGRRYLKKYTTPNFNITLRINPAVEHSYFKNFSWIEHNYCKPLYFNMKRLHTAITGAVEVMTLRELRSHDQFPCPVEKREFSFDTTINMSSKLGNKFALPERYLGSEDSVWVEFAKLAAQYKPLNLGQGFPDFAAPENVRKALRDVIDEPNVLLHQYTRDFGHPRLVNIIAKLYTKLVRREINPLTEFLISSGAYEALYCSIFGHIEKGDEVIIIEPFFDCYEPMVRAAGGVPKFISLNLKGTDGVISSADWVLNETELESMFNEKTKIFILNTPNNPLGKVFKFEELKMIADLCQKWNVLCISDEVYEWLVYEPNRHIRMCTLPGMWDRTLTIGSAGKTFSVTGWKIGWAYGPANLVRNLQIVHQNCVYTCPTPIQEAIARAFEQELDRFDRPDCYFKSLVRELEPKRNYMTKFLTESGFVPTVPEGGYFMIADWSALRNKIDLSDELDKYKDYQFAKWMSKNVGVQGIPPAAFYSTEHKHSIGNYIRYCFIKKDENLEKAAKVLLDWTSKS